MSGFQTFLRASAAPWLIIFFCCLCSRDGIDHGQYLKWAAATVNGNIHLLENKQQITSVTGVPFSPWSAGSGLLIAPFYLCMSVLGLQQGAGLVAGYVCVAIFWLCLFKAFKEFASSSQAALGCFLVAIGTPVGFYCSSISSETYALAPAAYLFLQTNRILNQRPVSVAGIASATAMLLMIRSFLAVFAWPALFAGLLLNRSGMPRHKFALACSFMIGLAILQVATTNYWMTGQAFHSPYSFGDEAFRSINWKAPFLLHILFDSFHGLVPSHPLVALGILSIPVLIGILIQRRRFAEAMVWAIFFLAISANIYVQSCWFYWWLAAPSFGMRGLVLCSVFAIGSLLRTRSLLEINTPRISNALLFSTILLSAYGWLHLSVGPTNCDRLMQLEAKLILGLSDWISVSGMIGGICGLLSGMLAYRSNRLSKEPLEKVSLSILITFFVGHYVRLLFTYECNLTFCIVCLSSTTAAISIGYVRKIHTANFASSAFTIATIAMLVAFTFLSFSTIPKLTHPKETQLVFNRPDARRAYLTLLEIPRFRDQAYELYEFFSRTQDPSWVNSKLPKPNDARFDTPLNQISSTR